MWDLGKNSKASKGSIDFYFCISSTDRKVFTIREILRGIVVGLGISWLI
uniref:Uncharacterized protein n=1 Tax=Anguilla anguilla TaxID=7936 RepID=A0A0E9XD77_ANGAN